MHSRAGVHPPQEPRDVLQAILQTAVAARGLFPRGGFEDLEANTLQVLIALRLDGEKNMTELVNELLLGQSTVSTALTRLQERGLISERVSDTDRRQRVQAITAEGEQLVDRFLARSAAA